MTSFTVRPRGPFDLAYQNQFFNPWPAIADVPAGAYGVAMAFPVEGWSGVAGVAVTQLNPTTVTVEVTAGPGVDVERAHDQALAAMSLDEDGSGWPDVGKRDKTLGALQRTHHDIRPTMFHSPFEAAAAFLIGHRISVATTRRIRARIAEEVGEQVEVAGQTVHAFPTPEQILGAQQLPGVPDAKLERLRGAARAALDGVLDRNSLRALPVDDALATLQQLDGVGPFFAQGILFRGAGLPDGLITDPLSMKQLAERYELTDATPAQLEAITEKWRPFRSWATTLLRMSAAQPHYRRAR